MFPGQWPPSPPLPETPETALHNAVLTGDMSNVLRLLGQGFSPNTSGGVYTHPLQAACLRGHEEVAFMLLYEGADVNAQGGRHGDALRAACFGGHEKIVELLIDHGAEVELPERYGPLYVACEAGHLGVVGLLLEKGVDWRRQWGRLGNVVDVALYYRDERLERMLREKGAVESREKGVVRDEGGYNSSDQEGVLSDVAALPNMTPRLIVQLPQTGIKSHDHRGALNLILQIYFHIKPLRQAIRDILSDESRGQIFTNALNGLFTSLEKSAIGEDIGPSYIHGVNDKLLAMLKDQTKDITLQHTISSLFKIHSKRYDISLISEASVYCNEEHWHLDLRTERARSLEESLQDSIQPYFLREDARVHGGMFYLGTEKGRVFEKFPPVLSLHPQNDKCHADDQTSIRNNYCFEYPEEIDLSPYLSMEADRTEPWVYTLLAVIVYDGNGEADSHYGYVRMNNGSFFRYHDKIFEPTTVEEVLSGNCGDFEVKYRNACMLYYCRKYKLGDILVDARENSPSDSLDQALDFFKKVISL